jgi:hypothetical protein
MVTQKIFLVCLDVYRVAVFNVADIFSGSFLPPGNVNPNEAKRSSRTAFVNIENHAMVGVAEEKSAHWAPRAMRRHPYRGRSDGKNYAHQGLSGSRISGSHLRVFA